MKKTLFELQTFKKAPKNKGFTIEARKLIEVMRYTDFVNHQIKEAIYAKTN